MCLTLVVEDESCMSKHSLVAVIVVFIRFIKGLGLV